MMIAFQRRSSGPTLPDLIQEAADARAATWSRALPLAAWCRTPAWLVLQGQQPPGLGWPSGRPPHHLRHSTRSRSVRTRLATAAGLPTRAGAAAIMRVSSRLVAAAMRLGHRTRPGDRP
jgi:hypothetical protein